MGKPKINFIFLQSIGRSIHIHKLEFYTNLTSFLKCSINLRYFLLFAFHLQLIRQAFRLLCYIAFLSSGAVYLCIALVCYLADHASSAPELS